MIRIVFFALFLFFSMPIGAQNGYFPPADNNLWATQTPESLGWNTEKLDELLEWLGDNETLAFIILKDGKLVVEQYYGLFGPESHWYWASAGKTVTAMLVGALEKQGLLDIENPTSDYLGTGWTSLAEEQEELITLRHQLTMTTGLDHAIENQHCTLPECLKYRKDAGEQWYYYNAPYTLLTHVLESAADTTLNEIVNNVFDAIPGLKLRYAEGALSPFNRVVFSRPLDMARFGLLISRQTAWEEGEPLLESGFYKDMLSPSQILNPSYGYLWWLNGQESFIPPRMSRSFPGPLTPEAPADMVSALGLNSQVLSIVPSRNLVIVRMGRDPGTLFGFTSQKWKLLSEVIESPTFSVTESQVIFELEQNYPNPFNSSTVISFSLPESSQIRITVYDLLGSLVATLTNAFYLPGRHQIIFDGGGLESGIYIYRLTIENREISQRMMQLL